MTETAVRILSEDAAVEARNAASRRDWAPIIEPLRSGKTLFFPEAMLREYDVKYLQLVFMRNTEWGLRFHTRKTEVDGVFGRIFWTTPKEAA
jgi:hypothetical protein